MVEAGRIDLSISLVELQGRRSWCFDIPEEMAPPCQHRKAFQGPFSGCFHSQEPDQIATRMGGYPVADGYDSVAYNAVKAASA